MPDSRTVSPTPRRAPPPSGAAPAAGGAPLGRAVAALVMVWCVLGAEYTITSLAGDQVGFRIARPAAVRGAVGMPLRGAREVTAIRGLLGAHARPGERWLVVLAPGVPELEREYVRAQLMVQEYPRQVAVGVVGGEVPPGTFAGVILPANVRGAGLAAPLGERGGMVAYRVPA